MDVMCLRKNSFGICYFITVKKTYICTNIYVHLLLKRQSLRKEFSLTLVYVTLWHLKNHTCTNIYVLVGLSKLDLALPCFFFLSFLSSYTHLYNKTVWLHTLHTNTYGWGQGWSWMGTGEGGTPPIPSQPLSILRVQLLGWHCSPNPSIY